MREIGQALKLNRETYLGTLHENSKGWITLATKDLKKSRKDQWKQRHYKIENLKNLDLMGLDTYISLNTFYKPCKASENVKEINCLYSDLDFYKGKCEYNNYTKEQILMNLNDNYFNKTLPIPSYIIDSGRGMYLIWLIEPVPYKALKEWQKIQKYILKQLKEFGADKVAVDVSRVLRVPGSINSKSNTRVEILEEYNYRYTLREIREQFYREEKKAKKKVKKKSKNKPKKVVSVTNKLTFLRTTRSLYNARIEDLEKLCELRNYKLKGKREIILFLYRYWLCMYTEDTEEALEKTLELNNKFNEPLKRNEVLTDTKAAEKVFKDDSKDYNYKNSTLIELLDITEEEQKELKTIISNEEYKRRENIRSKKNYNSVKAKENYHDKLKKDGKLTKKEEIEIRRKKIKDLLEQGLKQKEIYTVLNISKRTCISDIKFLKEQGLI